MKRISRILVVLISLFVMQPAQANACIAILAPVCELLSGSQILVATAGRLQMRLNIFLSQFQQKAHKKLFESSDTNAIGTAMAVERSRASRELPGPGAAHCAIASLGMDYNAGGRSLTGNPDPSQTGGGNTSPTPVNAAAIRVPTTVDSSGNYVPNGAALSRGGYGGDKLTHEQHMAKMREADNEYETKCRNNLTPECVNQYVKAKKDFEARDTNYGESARSTPLYNADVNVGTIFDNDTFPPAPQGKNVSLKDAAMDFCKNLTEPVILGPNRGPAKANVVDNRVYSNERSGWDARLSLARSICEDAVRSRAPKEVKQDGPDDWFKQTVEQYSRAACGQNADCQSAIAAYLPANSATMTISDFEQSKTLYTRILFTKNVSSMLGSATDNDVRKMLVHLDQLQIMLNYRMYEMQEKLNILKAAQLATMVDDNRTEPKVDMAN